MQLVDPTRSLDRVKLGTPPTLTSLSYYTEVFCEPLKGINYVVGQQALGSRAPVDLHSLRTSSEDRCPAKVVIHHILAHQSRILGSKEGHSNNKSKHLAKADLRLPALRPHFEARSESSLGLSVSQTPDRKRLRCDVLITVVVYSEWVKEPFSAFRLSSQAVVPALASYESTRPLRNEDSAFKNSLPAILSCGKIAFRPILFLSWKRRQEQSLLIHMSSNLLVGYPHSITRIGFWREYPVHRNFNQKRVFSTIEIYVAGMIQPLVHCHLSLLIPLEQSQLSISAANMATSALFGRIVKRHLWDEGTFLERGGERQSNSIFAGFRFTRSPLSSAFETAAAASSEPRPSGFSGFPCERDKDIPRLTDFLFENREPLEAKEVIKLHSYNLAIGSTKSIGAKPTLGSLRKKKKGKWDVVKPLSLTQWHQKEQRQSFVAKAVEQPRWHEWLEGLVRLTLKPRIRYSPTRERVACVETGFNSWRRCLLAPHDNGVAGGSGVNGRGASHEDILRTDLSEFDTFCRMLMDGFRCLAFVTS
ncbi:hypothetical protein TanjilG_19788 [Lupinus angustifolius]|uniref:Uncharacterized protein n=1 Tax=Lupinus angustifolius TaxID=3871 RepID=A0A1J7GMF5_LUPAN|nr:hypothetical protein TanjilG_19788 [Lupinus angustifolius]